MKILPVFLLVVYGVGLNAEVQEDYSAMSDAELRQVVQSERETLAALAEEDRQRRSLHQQSRERYTLNERRRETRVTSSGVEAKRPDVLKVQWQRYRSVQQELQRRERLEPELAEVPPRRRIPEDILPERKAYFEAQESIVQDQAHYLRSLGPLNFEQRQRAERQWLEDNQARLQDLETLRKALRNTPEAQARRASPQLTPEQLELKKRFEIATPEERRELRRAHREQLLRPISGTQR